MYGSFIFGLFIMLQLGIHVHIHAGLAACEIPPFQLVALIVLKTIRFSNFDEFKMAALIVCLHETVKGYINSAENRNLVMEIGSKVLDLTRAVVKNTP